MGQAGGLEARRHVAPPNSPMAEVPGTVPVWAQVFLHKMMTENYYLSNSSCRLSKVLNTFSFREGSHPASSTDLFQKGRREPRTGACSGPGRLARIPRGSRGARSPHPAVRGQSREQRSGRHPGTEILVSSTHIFLLLTCLMFYKLVLRLMVSPRCSLQYIQPAV